MAQLTQFGPTTTFCVLCEDVIIQVTLSKTSL